MNGNDSVWEFTKDFYEKELGIPKDVVEYLAVLDIVSLVASGHSNKTISNTLEKLSEVYIEEVCKKFLGFSGWKQDLDVNTYYVYRNTGKIKDAFILQIENITPLLDDIMIEKAFDVCNIYEKMKEEIEKYHV